MSSETWREITQVLALLPWLAIIVAIVWCWLIGLRDDARASRADEQARPSGSPPRRGERRRRRRRRSRASSPT